MCIYVLCIHTYTYVYMYIYVYAFTASASALQGEHTIKRTMFGSDSDHEPLFLDVESIKQIVRSSLVTWSHFGWLAYIAWLSTEAISERQGRIYKDIYISLYIYKDAPPPQADL